MLPNATGVSKMASGGPNPSIELSPPNLPTFSLGHQGPRAFMIFVELKVNMERESHES